jgi:hypothetical protein
MEPIDVEMEEIFQQILIQVAVQASCSSVTLDYFNTHSWVLTPAARMLYHCDAIMRCSACGMRYIFCGKRQGRDGYYGRFYSEDYDSVCRVDRIFNCTCHDQIIKDIIQ